jgi:outer membrane receptor for ferric coprogen and ferric-rhodotorulic acid
MAGLINRAEQSPRYVPRTVSVAPALRPFPLGSPQSLSIVHRAQSTSANFSPMPRAIEKAAGISALRLAGFEN